MLRCLALLLLVTLAAPAVGAGPDADSGTISIMRPEPGAPVKKQRGHKPAAKREPAPKGFGVNEDTRRGSSNPVYPLPSSGPQAPLPTPRIEQPEHRATVPPPLYVPETGRTLPNLPSPSGTETPQDKAARCAHQAGVYGPNATGNPNAYIGSCINQ